MKITVESRYFFENLRGTVEEAALFKNSRVISVNSVRIAEEPPFSKQYWTADNVLILRFDDVDYSDPFIFQGTRFMSEADAEAIAAFVESPDPRPIVVHCTAGISRSGAIGTCLNEYFNKKLSLNETAHQAFLIAHPYINTNLHVMKLLWKRLQIEI
ncbi:MAG: hypothetical protein WCJ02_06060 [bacterium]